MPYIKARKIWTNKFSKGDLDRIWDFFKSLCGNVDWETMQYADFFRNSNIIYPETDKWDDTEGIKPKQIKALLDALGFDMTETLLKHLSDNGNTFRTQPYYEDGYISWKTVFKDKVEPMLDEENPQLEIAKYLVSNAKDKPSNFGYYNYSDEVYEAVLAGKLDFSDFKAVLTKKPYPQNKKLSIDELSMKDFWDKRKEIWKKELGITPQVQELLLLDPKFWHKDIFLESLEYHYKIKQFAKLKSEDQNAFIKLYKTFGPHIKYLNSYIKERKFLVNRSINCQAELYHKMSEPNQAFVKIIEESKRGIDVNLSLQDFEKYITTLTYFEDARTDISKKNRLKLHDLNVLKEAYTFIMSIIKAGNESSLKNMNYQTMSVLNKYGLNENQKKWALALFKKTCHLKTEVPLFSETLGDYTIEMVDKNDIRGLVAGNATNCCQTLQRGSRDYSYGGNNCVYYGAEEKNSTFFLVSKNNRIIAQSWVWMHKGQLTFDNIEVLGQELRDSIADCYQLYADYVLNLPKTKIKRVTVGTGHSDLSLSNYWKQANDFEVIDEAYDARNSQYEIKASKK